MIYVYFNEILKVIHTNHNIYKSYIHTNFFKGYQIQVLTDRNCSMIKSSSIIIVLLVILSVFNIHYCNCICISIRRSPAILTQSLPVSSCIFSTYSLHERNQFERDSNSQNTMGHSQTRNHRVREFVDLISIASTGFQK